MMMILLIYLLVYCLKNSSSNAFQAAEILEQKKISKFGYMQDNPMKNTSYQ